MNNSIRLLIALGFAAGAAILNFLWVQQNLPKYRDYTAYAAEMAVGSSLDAEDKLKKVTLPERSGFTNSEVYIPWEDRGILIGLNVTRSIKADELALKNDAEMKETPTEFSTLGPFRLYSVRDQIVGKTVEGQQNSSSGSVVGRIPVTLIVSTVKDQKGKPTYKDEDIKQLLRILENDQKSEAKNRRGTSILAVVAMSGSSGEKELKLKPDEVALVIDLPNVPVITDVLLNNPSPEIGFVIPKSLNP